MPPVQLMPQPETSVIPGVRYAKLAILRSSSGRLIRYCLLTCDPSAALTVLNKGGAEVTSTVSVCCPTCSRKSRSVCWPTRSTIFDWTRTLNPAASTVAV